MPIAQLVYGFDGGSDNPTAEKPDWYDRTVFRSPPADYIASHPNDIRPQHNKTHRTASLLEQGRLRDAFLKQGF